MKSFPMTTRTDYHFLYILILTISSVPSIETDAELFSYQPRKLCLYYYLYANAYLYDN